MWPRTNCTSAPLLRAEARRAEHSLGSLIDDQRVESLPTLYRYSEGRCAVCGDSSMGRVTIPAATVNTREPDRDTHLKSADFFDVEKFPTLSFKSTAVIRRPNDELEVEGDLTIHGVTRKVRLAVEGPTVAGKDPWGNTRIGASAITKINRKDFGLVWNTALETGGILVGDDVAITIDAEFIKA